MARGEPTLDPVYDPAAYVQRALQVVAEGFTAIKFDVDVANPWKMDVYDRSISRQEHEHIMTIIRQVRAAIGPYVDLAVDLHGSFNLADALRICKDVEPLDLLVAGGPHPLGIGERGRPGQALHADRDPHLHG